jgi:hypothetical protein
LAAFDSIRHRWRAFATIESEQLALAGSLTGVLFITGALTVALLPLLPGVTDAHWPIILAVAIAAGIWGTVCLRVINWQTVPGALIHISTAFGAGLIVTVIASTGGGASPGWIYLYFIVVLISWFFDGPLVLAYMTGCAITMLLPLLYDTHVTHGPFIGECVIGVPSFFVLSGVIVAGKGLLSQMRDRAERLAAEQGALRRVATAVADGDSPDEIYALVAEEAARLLDASASGILRFESEHRAIVIGSWSQLPNGRYWPGTPVEVRPGTDLDRQRRRPARLRL